MQCLTSRHLRCCLLGMIKAVHRAEHSTAAVILILTLELLLVIHQNICVMSIVTFVYTFFPQLNYRHLGFRLMWYSNCRSYVCIWLSLGPSCVIVQHSATQAHLITWPLTWLSLCN